MPPSNSGIIRIDPNYSPQAPAYRVDPQELRALPRVEGTDIQARKRYVQTGEISVINCSFIYTQNISGTLDTLMGTWIPDQDYAMTGFDLFANIIGPNAWCEVFMAITPNERFWESGQNLGRTGVTFKTAYARGLSTRGGLDVSREFAHGRTMFLSKGRPIYFHCGALLPSGLSQLQGCMNVYAQSVEGNQ